MLLDDEKKFILGREKLDTLLRACRDNADEKGAYMLDNREQIENGVISIRYHPTCRALYT